VTNHSGREGNNNVDDVQSMDQGLKLHPVYARDLTKVYPTGVRAVQSVSLELNGGEIVGLLGPNGAGKTTFLKMLGGILRPSAGGVYYGGENIWESKEETVRQLKRRIGFLPERPFLYPKLTALEYLRFVGGLYGIDKRRLQSSINMLFGLFRLQQDSQAFLETYSYGMQKKVALAASLINGPDVLLLDEPTNGLDPRSARDLKDVIRQQKQEGRVILLSTHLLDVAERLCDRVAILDKGTLIFQGTIDNLRGILREKSDASLEDLFLRMTTQEENNTSE
jgi:ABC-2 type transport system ATP-binding protein